MDIPLLSRAINISFLPCGLIVGRYRSSSLTASSDSAEPRISEPPIFSDSMKTFPLLNL